MFNISYLRGSLPHDSLETECKGKKCFAPFQIFADFLLLIYLDVYSNTTSFFARII